MYEEFFRFSSSPFRLSPDPRFFFGSRSHNKAMAYLHYGLRQGEGFIVITGEIGAGKSMLIGHLIDQLDRSNVVAAQLLTANLEPAALLSHILSAFRIEPSGEGESAEIEAFEDFLFDQMSRGRRVLLIVDEAQNLPKQTIEELRMLSNIDYDGTPLFQVFLVGQPEFKDLMAAHDMEQLRQRVIASYHLQPLDRDEAEDYIKHRLAVVGWANDPSISSEAFDSIYAATGGVPRKMNRLCNRIFLSCALEKQHAIDADAVHYVVADMQSDGLETGDLKPDLKALEARKAEAERTKQPASKPERKQIAANGAEPKEETKRPPVVVPLAEVRKVRSGASKPEAPNQEPAAVKPPANPATAPAAKREAAPQAKPNEASKPEVAAPPKEVKPLPVKEAPKMKEVAAPKNEDEDAPMTSVLDRLRSTSPKAKTRNAEAAPSPASLSEVAKAIEEISMRGDRDDDAHAAAGDVEMPDLEIDTADQKSWRASVTRTLDDARAELKSAHANVSQLRRKLSDIEKGRIERRDRISANLTRAEELLAELRKAWR